MNTLSRCLTAGSLAATGIAATLALGGAAQAQIVGTGGLSGNASLSTSTTNPVIDFLDIPGIVGGPGTGQFAGSSTFNFIPPDINLVGSGPTYTYSTITNFLGITRDASEGGGTVQVDLIGGLPTSFFTRSQSGDNFAFGGLFLPANFIEPDGEVVGGSLTINASSNTAGGATSQTYQITFNKQGLPPIGVPEPSTVLSILAVAGVGAVSRRLKK